MIRRRIFNVVITLRRDDVSSRPSVTTTNLATVISLPIRSIVRGVRERNLDGGVVSETTSPRNVLTAPRQTGRLPTW